MPGEEETQPRGSTHQAHHVFRPKVARFHALWAVLTKLLLFSQQIFTRHSEVPSPVPSPGAGAQGSAPLRKETKNLLGTSHKAKAHITHINTQV